MPCSSQHLRTLYEGRVAHGADREREDELAYLLHLREELHAQLREVTNAIRNLKRKRKRLLERAQHCSVDELMRVAASKMHP